MADGMLVRLAAAPPHHEKAWTGLQIARGHVLSLSASQMYIHTYVSIKT